MKNAVKQTCELEMPIELARFSMTAKPSTPKSDASDIPVSWKSWFKAKLGVFEKNDDMEPKFTRNYHSKFVVWLTCYKAPAKELTLYLNYKDQLGEHSIELDRQTMVSDGVFMLSGDASFKVVNAEPIVTLECDGLSDYIPFKLEGYEIQSLSPVHA